MDRIQQENEELRAKSSQLQQDNESLVLRLSQMQLELNNLGRELETYRASSYTESTACTSFDEASQWFLLDCYTATSGDQTIANIEEHEEPCVRSTAHLCCLVS